MDRNGSALLPAFLPSFLPQDRMDRMEWMDRMDQGLFV
jgi:hypothetical protein